jgi:aminopeptidase N
MPALQVASYDVVVDLTGSPAVFWSRTEIRFRCSDPGAPATADINPLNVRQALLNGALRHDSAAIDGGLQLTELGRDNTLIVEAEFAYASPGGVGLLRETQPDGHACVYSKCYPHGAPHIFCCFDQPAARAPLTLSVRAPAGWSCLANAPVAGRLTEKASTLWTFRATRPIAPFLVSMCAGLSRGPAFRCEHRDGSPLAVTAHAVPQAAELLDAALDAELFQQPLLYYEQALGVRYPDDKCDLAFVPRFGPLAFGAPGLITLQEKVLNPEGKPETYLPVVVSHELSHAWFGGLIVFQPSEDEWLEEAIATYVSRSALEARYPDVAPWNDKTSTTWPDHGYAASALPLRQLETMIGRQAVMNGLGDLLRRHVNQTVTKDDLVACWSRASGDDLREWAAGALIPVPPG